MGKRFAMCISGLLSGAIPQVAWAEGAGGSYRGIATLYHFFLVTMYFVAEYVSA